MSDAGDLLGAAVGAYVAVRVVDTVLDGPRRRKRKRRPNGGLFYI